MNKYFLTRINGWLVIAGLLLILSAPFMIFAQNTGVVKEKLIFMNKTRISQQLRVFMNGVNVESVQGTGNSIILNLKPGRNEFIAELTSEFDGVYSYNLGGKSYSGIIKRRKPAFLKVHDISNNMALGSFLDEFKKQTGIDPYNSGVRVIFLEKGEDFQVQPGVNVVVFPENSRLSLKSTDSKKNNAWFLNSGRAYQYNFNDYNVEMLTDQMPEFVSRIK